MNTSELIQYVSSCRRRLRPRGLGGIFWSLALPLIVRLVQYAIERWILENRPYTSNITEEGRELMIGPAIFGSGPEALRTELAASQAYEEVFRQ